MDWDSILAEARAAAAPRLVPATFLPDAATVVMMSGSFDPVTTAHVELVEAARPAGGAGLLVYSARTLPKEAGGEPPLLPERDRLRLLVQVARRMGLAVAVASHGLLADQAAAAGDAMPGARLWVAMGSDKVLQLLDPRWYDDRDAALERLFSRVEGVAYAERSPESAGARGTGVSPVAARLRDRDVVRWRRRFRRVALAPGTAAISSSEVRRRIRGGETIDDLVPPEVATDLRRDR